MRPSVPFAFDAQSSCANELTSRVTGAVIRMVLEGGYVQTGTGELVIYGPGDTERCG